MKVLRKQEFKKGLELKESYRSLSFIEFSEIINNLRNSMEEVMEVPVNELTREKTIYSPELDDLYRLYRFVVDNSVLSILEIGSGWSTFALFLGLKQNIEKCASQYTDSGRFTNLFKMVSVDSSRFFYERARNRVEKFFGHSTDLFFLKTDFKMNLLHGTPVALMEPSPRWDFDLIYLDAPEPEQIDLNGCSSPINTKNDLPICGDVLKFEPYMLPNTSIIIDGRTANSRFVSSHLYRNWNLFWSRQHDVSFFYLDEEPLGTIHEKYLEFRKLFSIERKLDNFLI